MQLKNLKTIFVGFLLAISFFISPSEMMGQTVFNGTSSTKNDDGVRTYRYNNNKQKFSIEYEGEITLSNDDKEITAISNNGFIEIRKTRFGKRRRLIIESEGGTLVHKYFIGSKELPFNPDGKKWLAEILQEVVRTTTIAAQSRVDRFYKRGGAKAVMNEVKSMESDYVKSKYIKLLLEKKLNNNDLINVIETAGNSIKSDHYVSQILKSNQKAFLATDGTRTAYIKAASSINSDHYRSQILKTVINDSSINDKQMASLLDITKSIKSGHYLSQILTSVMDKRQLNKQNMNTIMLLSRQIKSDHYKAQVLRKALKKENLSQGNYEAFLSTLSEIKSDHNTSQVINDMMKNDMDNASFSKLLNIVNQNIESDHYAATIYKKIAKNKNISDAQLIQLFESASSNIGSGYSLSSVLTAYSSRVKKSSQKVRSAYTKAAKSIKSETYYGRALRAIE